MRSWRQLAYLIARLLGDVRAVRNGRIARRVGNKVIGRTIVKRLWL